MATKKNTSKTVETLIHEEAKRKNIPSVEQQSIASQEHVAAKQIRYPRNTDLDPQLVWRGKDEQDWSDLVVNAPPLYISSVRLKSEQIQLVSAGRYFCCASTRLQGA